MINIFGLAKNSVLGVSHLASGNHVAAGASFVKAGVSCIPVVGHVPGVGKLVDTAITGEQQHLTRAEANYVHDQLDFDHDGDIDLDDLSDMLHHVTDFFSS